MASVLEIIVRLKDQASRELAKVDKQLDNVGKEAKKTGLNFETLSKGFLTVGTAAAGVATAVGLAVRDIVNDTVEYGKAVDDVSRALGTSTEEASKLIQIADDLRISQDQLKLGFRFALNEGINPSIAGLKGLADEYKQLPNATAKAQFAMEKFGSRSGLEMQKILELTSEQIDEMAKSAEDAGLVLDREAVAATKRYWQELDQLNDVVEGVKTQLGGELLPVLIEVAKASNEFASQELDTISVGRKMREVQKEVNKAWVDRKLGLIDNFRSGMEFSKIQAKLRDGLIDEEEALRMVGDVAKKYGVAIDDSAALTKELAGRTQELTEETEQEITVFDDLTGYQNEIAAGYQRMGMTADEAKQAAVDLTVATGEAARELLRAKEELEKARTIRFFDVDMDFGDTAAAAIEAIDFRNLGGDAGAALVESIKQAFVTGAITEAEADAYLEKLAVAAAAIQVTLGNVDTEEAVEDLSEQLSKPIEEVQPLLEAELAKPLDLTQMLSSFNAQIDAMEDRKRLLTEAGELPIIADPGDIALGKLTTLQTTVDTLVANPYTIYVDVVQRGNVPGKVTVNPDAGGAHGLDMVVPPGFPNDSFLVAATSGERVQVGRGSRPGGSGTVYIGGDTYNIFSAGAMKLAEAEAQSRRRARLNDSMGVG